MSRVLAVDIGASSYRIIEGIYTDGKLSTQELARFKHAPIYESGHYYWDVTHMTRNLVQTIKSIAGHGERICSIGFDTFGTDFGLLDSKKKLLANPLAYRDNISAGMYEQYFQQEDLLYKRVGGNIVHTSQ